MGVKKTKEREPEDRGKKRLKVVRRVTLYLLGGGRG